jgi:hypothetical protein
MTHRQAFHDDGHKDMMAANEDMANGDTAIHYVRRYMYMLTETYALQTGIHPEHRISTRGIQLGHDGVLTIQQGYLWDGPSGPAVDTNSLMRASLVHDALYELMQLRLLDGQWRKAADVLLRRLSIEDGCWRIRAWWVYWAVRLCGWRIFA